MKKSLLALAVGIAVLPLTSQAATDLYGRLNVSLDNVAVHSMGDSVPISLSTFGPAESSWNVSSIQDWVGIKGEATLYNQNLKAIYQIERGLDMTDGDGTFSTRNTYAGLAGDSWGKVFLGTYDGIVKQAEGSVDQFNNTGADMQLYIGGQNRYNNTINYSSPSFSGLSFNAQIIPGEGKRQDVSQDPIGTAPVTNIPIYPSEHGLADAYGVSVNFTQDTFWAHLAYEKGAESAWQSLAGLQPLFSAIPGPPGVDVASVFSAMDMRTSTLRLTAGVNIGNIKLAMLVQQRKADALHEMGGSLTETDSRNDYMVSGSFAVTDRLTLKAQAADAAGNFLLKDDGRKIRSYTVGADYALGKNVTSYVLYSANSMAGSIGGAGVPPYLPPGTSDDSKYNLASVGITYQF